MCHMNEWSYCNGRKQIKITKIIKHQDECVSRLKDKILLFKHDIQMRQKHLLRGYMCFILTPFMPHVRGQTEHCIHYFLGCPKFFQ